MADDDEITDPDEELELDQETDGPDLDDAELEVGELEADLDEDAEEFEAADDEFEDDADDDTDAGTAGPVRRSVSAEEEDDDDDIIAPDDVEADLDTILKDRLVAAEDEVNEDEEEVEERGEQADRLQPKRADEQLCPTCFLLVRHTAPMCPVGDDDCPLFSR